MSAIPAVVSRLRKTFSAGVTKPLEWRGAQLTALKAMLTEHDGDFLAALHTDLGRTRLRPAARNSRSSSTRSTTRWTTSRRGSRPNPRHCPKPCCRVRAASCGSRSASR